LVAAQFAASAANHVLPAGLGAGAVNLRFLMRCGLPAGRGASALAVKAAAGAVVRLALIAVLAPACPGLLRTPHVPMAAVLALTVAAAVAVALLRARVWPRCRGAVSAVVADIRALHARPVRAAALWGGSLAFAGLHALVLFAVIRAVELPLSPARVALLYLAASGAAALLPTPGGLGSLDAALALALTASGTPAATAASAVLGYRHPIRAPGSWGRTRTTPRPSTRSTRGSARRPAGAAPRPAPDAGTPRHTGSAAPPPAAARSSDA
ncbi:lysylphosphatidylglycerol synthase domain-containing protein, partial [Streptomyces sp. NPDC005921]